MMVSIKERDRLARMFDDMKERMDRQQESISRLAQLNTHLMAALLEIANAENYTDKKDLKERAQAALDAAEVLRVEGQPKEETHENQG